MGALAILALIEAGVEVAQKITEYVQGLKGAAMAAGATAEDVDVAVARGKAAAAKVSAHADKILTDNPGDEVK